MAQRFMWYELLTTDPRAAERFYPAVVGWTVQKIGEGPDAYAIYDAGRGGVAGMPPAAHVPAGPNWHGYVGVPDVDACAEKVLASGGNVHVHPHDLPGVGRAAMVDDPQGVVFTLFKGNQPEGPPTSATNEPGYVGWHELVTTVEPDAAFPWYAEMFGWVKLDSFDMGPAGQYLLWGLEPGGPQMGGMMMRQNAETRPHWNFYFQVAGIDAGAERVKAAGGQVTNGPHEVPGGSWILEGLDPQGAPFALVSTTK